MKVRLCRVARYGVVDQELGWELIRSLGAVPRVLVWDGEGAVGRWRGRRPELTQATQAFRGTLGIKVVLCKPNDPEAKGLVERALGLDGEVA